MLRSACRIAFAIALSTLFGPVDRAFSQVVSTISATPAQYSGAGETITFMIGFNSGNVAVAAVNVKSALGVAYTCSGWASGQTGQTGTCTGRYTTKTGDLPNAIQEAPEVTLVALGNVPHQLTYQGSNIVITVVVAAPAAAPAPFRERSSATRRRPRPAGPCYRTRFPGGLQTSRTRRRVTGAQRTWIHCAAAQPIRRRPSIASRTRSTITGMPRPSVRPSRPVLEDNLGASPQRRPAQNGPFDAMLLSAAS